MRYNFELWRFVMPLFLHANFMHLFMNLVSQLILGSQLESTVLPFKKFALFYLLTGLGGTLFSSLLTDGLSVGASTSIFGLIGLQIAALCVRWE